MSKNKFSISEARTLSWSNIRFLGEFRDRTTCVLNILPSIFFQFFAAGDNATVGGECFRVMFVFFAVDESSTNHSIRKHTWTEFCKLLIKKLLLDQCIFGYYHALYAKIMEKAALTTVLRYTRLYRVDLLLLGRSRRMQRSNLIMISLENIVKP